MKQTTLESTQTSLEANKTLARSIWEDVFNSWVLCPRHRMAQPGDAKSPASPVLNSSSRAYDATCTATTSRSGRNEGGVMDDAITLGPGQGKVLEARGSRMVFKAVAAVTD